MVKTTGSRCRDAQLLVEDNRLLANVFTLYLYVHFFYLL